MSTRSTITAAFSDGYYRSVYCHFDGYPDGVGKKLVNNYTTQASVEGLISHGGISSLGDNLNETVFYSRDRGEEIKIGVGLTPSSARGQRMEFNYLWNGDEWLVNEYSLSKALDQNDT